MKITIHSTSKIVTLQTRNGNVSARIWEGHTERGTPVHAFVTRICPSIEQPVPPELSAEFERDLQECEPPTAGIAAIPMRLIL